MTAKKIFKPIVGFPNYQVSNTGEVRSQRRGQSDYTPMKPSTFTGYANVKLSDGQGGQKGFQVHRLVATAFIKNPKGYEIVNHKDGDKLNNSVSNLEWTDRRGNAQHYVKELAPHYSAARKAKKENDLRAKISIVDFAHKACTANPELFYSVYQTVMVEE
jgi:hypothetical protein